MANYSEASGGDFNTIRINTRFVHSQVPILQSRITFNLSIIYGQHTIPNRMGFWCDLKDIMNTLNCHGVITGNFNIMRLGRVNGNPVR